MAPDFADWFRSKTKFASATAQVVDVFVSKSNNLGESDLIVLFAPEHGDRFALLIEDKVDAPIQVDQAHRYRLRADREVKRNVFADYELVLCAPQTYLTARPDNALFDRIVSYEDIAAFIGRSDSSQRAQYRSSFVATAATRRTNTWAREVDVVTNEFWHAAYRIAEREFPLLEMKPRKLTKGSIWITLRPHDMPTKPKNVSISFKGDRGFIDLTFANTVAYRFGTDVSKLLEPDMTVHQTGASAAIRIEVPGFRISDDIEVEMPKVRVAFGASTRLIQFYRVHRATLDDAARRASSD